MNVHDYIREEVRRQGHDLSDPADGGLRVSWMLNAWRLAGLWSKLHARPTVEHIVRLGQAVEPIKNAGGLRRVPVRVGTRFCPRWDVVPDMLARLVEHGTELEPLEFYRELELIHPFVDGNGRTGKIVLNWLADTLSEPFFPPDDFWNGVPIRNP